MSSTTPGRPAMDSSQRRGSWARALDKVRAAMKRRSSSGKSLPQMAPLGQEATSAVPANTLAAHPSETRDNTAIPLPAVSELLAIPLDIIAVDTEDQAEIDDLDEALLPMYSSRTTITDERAKLLFAKYGLQYAPRSRRPPQEPPSKIRRVEKPVRLRVHWTCHECHIQFGIEKTCTSCGHRRCRECQRHPPKRIREILDTTRQQIDQEETERQRATISTSVVPVVPIIEVPAATVRDPDLQQYRQELATSTDAALSKSSLKTPPGPGVLISQQLDVDQSAEVEESSTLGPLIYARPRSAVILKPKAQVVRRTCHKCESYFVPASRMDCAKCGHERCDLCPKYSPKQDHRSENAIKAAREQPPMIKAVERVYRKPRQRVRYTCENCSTLFIDTDRCNECGHERCNTCHREPPKRPPRQHDPDVIQSVATRLATYTGDPGRPPGITASAG